MRSPKFPYVLARLIAALPSPESCGCQSRKRRLLAFLGYDLDAFQ